MALQIDPVNFSGLAAIAGRGAGALNITAPGEMGLKSLQMIMQDKQAKNQLKVQAALDMAKIRSQDEQALRQAGIQRQQLEQQQQQFNQGQAADRSALGLKASLLPQQQMLQQQQAMQQQANSDRTYGLAAQNQGFNQQQAQQKSMQELMKQQAVELSNKKKEDLDKMGSFAVQASTSMDKVTDPQVARATQLEIINDAVANKFISKEDGTAMSNMPISSFKNFLGTQVSLTNKAADLKAMRGDNKDVTLKVGPNGEIEYHTLGKKETDQTEKDLNIVNKNIEELKQLRNIPDRYFGAQSLVEQGGTFIKEWAGLPVSKEEKEDRLKYKSAVATSKRLALDTIKELSGLAYTDTQFAFLQDVLPSIDAWSTPTDFKAKSIALEGYLNRSKGIKEKLLAQGMEIGTKRYEEAAKQELISRMAPPPEDPAMMNYYKQKYPNWSEDKIRRAISGGK